MKNIVQINPYLDNKEFKNIFNVTKKTYLTENKETIKTSTINKLKSLGLNDDEVKTLVSK